MASQTTKHKYQHRVNNSLPPDCACSRSTAAAGPPGEVVEHVAGAEGTAGAGAEGGATRAAWRAPNIPTNRLQHCQLLLSASLNRRIPSKEYILVMGEASECVLSSTARSTCASVSFFAKRHALQAAEAYGSNCPEASVEPSNT